MHACYPSCTQRLSFLTFEHLSFSVLMAPAGNYMSELACSSCTDLMRFVRYDIYNTSSPDDGLPASSNKPSIEAPTPTPVIDARGRTDMSLFR
jgi:hypothetical protein